MTMRVHPKAGWRWARRVTQAATLIAVIGGPILGAWHRRYRGAMSAWDMTRWELPPWLNALLPDAPSSSVYDANLLMGGGGASDFFGIAAADPIAAAVALTRGFTVEAVVAWLIPVLLAVFFGRIFCGWFCPFGWLSRGLDRLISILPWKHRGFEIPRHRPVRWFVLLAALVGGAVGVPLLSWIFLPHVVLQETIYSVLILGGVGAVGGALLGLLAVGAIFGPTVYCATICPTGAVLGALGTRRTARVVVPEPAACGSCTLCHRACWLGLDPKAGAGQDCDSCARCFTACPKAKMVVEVGRPLRPTTLAIVAAALLSMAMPSDSWAQAPPVERKPELLLNAYRETNAHTVAVTLVSLRDVRMTHDTERQHHVELSAYVVAGSKIPTDSPGMRAPEADVYRGPLQVELKTATGTHTVAFDEPSSPRSAIVRPIYRRKLDIDVQPGDVVTLQPIAGLFDTPMTWTVPDVLLAREADVPTYSAIAAMVYGGLIAMGLGFRKETDHE